MTQQPPRMPPTKKPIWKRWWFITAAAVIVLIGIGRALGGEEASDDASPVTPKPTAIAVSTTPAATSDDTASPAATNSCEPVSDLVANDLAESIDDDASATASAAVKTGDSWVVAIRIAGPEAVNDSTAVFEVLNLEEAGQTRSVDGMARQFTGFPESAFSVADEPVKEVLACV